MKIRVVRKYLTGSSTIGKLYINGVFFCYTLEDVVRETKIAGETAIPYGKYPISLYNSPKFGADTPMINNVPNFTYILIHSGNDAQDTKGCLLVGYGMKDNYITKSREAYSDLQNLIEDAIRSGEPVSISFVYEEAEILRKVLLVLALIAAVYLIYRYYKPVIALLTGTRSPALNYSS